MSTNDFYPANHYTEIIISRDSTLIAEIIEIYLNQCTLTLMSNCVQNISAKKINSNTFSWPNFQVLSLIEYKTVL